MLSVGEKVPGDVEVQDSDGKAVTLQQRAGSWVVLYFYPKDDTPGCTLEAKSFRDSQHALKRLDATVIGISRDSGRSHERFADKYDLQFELWSDPKHALMSAFGVWQKKKFMGREYMGTVRSTFVIDPSGVIRHVFERVRPEGHGEEVVRVLREIQRIKK